MAAIGSFYSFSFAFSKVATALIVACFVDISTRFIGTMMVSFVMQLLRPLVS